MGQTLPSLSLIVRRVSCVHVVTLREYFSVIRRHYPNWINAESFLNAIGIGAFQCGKTPRH
jgi:hypothetical protein